MGWCSGTKVFDAVVKELLKENTNKEKIIKKLIDVLEDMDWDCHQDSDYFDHPMIKEIMKKKHPDWFDDEEE